MNIISVVEILALAVLLFIAAELYIIARELSRGVSFLVKDREGREGREVQNAGQTINVNLAPSQTGAPSAVQSATIAPVALAGQGALSNTIAAQVAPAEQAAPPQPEAPAAKSSPSSQFAVKCSRCQAENSSYRHECFNCGGPL